MEVMNRRPGRALRLGALVLCWLSALAPALTAQETPASQPLQRGFSSLELGMSLEAAQRALEGDESFAYRGEPDVQFLPRTETPIIETAGRAFIDRAVLQFHEEELYILSLLLDRTRLGYFAVYEGLVEQYGTPTRLDPSQAVWEDDQTRVSLERPLTVKYLDLATFTGIVDSGRMEEALDEITRERFLEQL